MSTEPNRAPAAVDLDPDPDPDDELVTLTVALPNHPFASSESLWAEPERDDPDAFVLRCVPRFAYGLNRGDRVRADRATAGRTIRAVLQASGHSTLRVTFLRRVLPKARRPMLDTLRALGVCYEGSVMDTVAIDVPPRANMTAVLAQLRAWERAGKLHFETGAPKVEGSFDDAPAPEAAAAMQAMLDAVTAHQARRPR